MVRFGVLSSTFWSIGVDLVAGAVFKGPKTTSNRLTPARMAWKANSSTKIVVSHSLGHEFLDENSGPQLLEGFLG